MRLKIIVLQIGWLLLFGFPAYSQTTWEQAQKTKKAEIDVFYFDFEPFCYTDTRRLRGLEQMYITGIEYDLSQAFFKFVEEKYAIKITANYIKEPIFTKLYEKIKNGKPGNFALSSLSITEDRLKELKFSPPYLPDIEVLICSNNVPIVRDTIEFIEVFKNLKAVTVAKSTYEKNLNTLKKFLKNLKMDTVNHFDQISARLAEESDLFSYSQLSSYLLARKKGILIKRQNLFKIQKIGHAIAYPLNSDWDEPMKAFFSDKGFNSLITKILQKYFGNDVNDLITSVASNTSERNKSIDLLTKENEIQNLEISRKELEISRQTLLRNSFLVGLLVILAFTFLLYSRYTFKQKTNQILTLKNVEIEAQKNQLVTQNEELTRLNEEVNSQRDYIEKRNQQLNYRNQQITQSINAARTIQHAMLPYPARMKEALKDYFVVYRPKDVVSGDFYWLTRLEGKTVIAAVDCTGHGIPGALMSMIGNTILDKIVAYQRILDPTQILTRLHAEIRIALKQDETHNKDGMDVALVVLEKLPNDEIKITFSGAKRPLHCISSSNLSEVIELKGSNKSIGGFQNDQKTFFSQDLIVPNESLIYLSSDGYADQNNMYRKKLSEDKFKKLLIENAHLPMTEQKKALEHALDEHQIGTLQRDDILVWGIKI